MMLSEPRFSQDEKDEQDSNRCYCVMLAKMKIQAFLKMDMIYNLNQSYKS